MISPLCCNISKTKIEQKLVQPLKTKDSRIAQARPALILIFERDVGFDAWYVDVLTCLV